MIDLDFMNSTYKLSRELAERIKQLVESTEDYDFQRLLKKIEAQVMDIQHNLKLATRIADNNTRGER